MLNYCLDNLEISETQRELILFRKLDGESRELENNSYSAIVSSFTVQWFEDIVNSLNRLINTLKPHGILLIAFPNTRSFPEWKAMCNDLSLPFTGNKLPDTMEIKQKLSTLNLETHIQEEEITITYNNSGDFFRSLKAIGAGLNLKQEKLSPSEMKKLINYWNYTCFPKKIEITYSVTFLTVIV